jgi:hypothetical protein
MIGEKGKIQTRYVHAKQFDLKPFAATISDPVLGSFLLAASKHLVN